MTGARYTHGTRPDHISYTSGHVGYVAPPSAATGARQTEQEIHQTVTEFISAQREAKGAGLWIFIGNLF